LIFRISISTKAVIFLNHVAAIIIAISLQSNFCNALSLSHI
jgi:hypothetical protein